MCRINIYAVTRNQVSLLIKTKVFDFFPLICYEKKSETFLSVKFKREDSNNGAQAHTLGSSSKSGCLVTNEPSAIFLLQQNRAERARIA